MRALGSESVFRIPLNKIDRLNDWIDRFGVAHAALGLETQQWRTVCSAFSLFASIEWIMNIVCCVASQPVSSCNGELIKVRLRNTNTLLVIFSTAWHFLLLLVHLFEFLANVWMRVCQKWKYTPVNYNMTIENLRTIVTQSNEPAHTHTHSAHIHTHTHTHGHGHGHEIRTNEHNSSKIYCCSVPLSLSLPLSIFFVA